MCLLLGRKGRSSEFAGEGATSGEVPPIWWSAFALPFASAFCWAIFSLAFSSSDSSRSAISR